MKQGRTLAELGAELERQRNARKGYLVNTSALSMKTKDGKSIVQFENGHPLPLLSEDAERLSGPVR